MHVWAGSTLVRSREKWPCGQVQLQNPVLPWEKTASLSQADSTPLFPPEGSTATAAGDPPGTTDGHDLPCLVRRGKHWRLGARALWSDIGTFFISATY